MLARKIENIDIVPPKILVRSVELFFLYTIYTNAQLIRGLFFGFSTLVLGYENTKQIYVHIYQLSEKISELQSENKIFFTSFAVVLILSAIRALDLSVNLAWWNILNCIPGLRTHYQKNILALEDNLRALENGMGLSTPFSNENKIRLKVRDISTRNSKHIYSEIRGFFSRAQGEDLKCKIKIFRHERFAMRQNVLSSMEKINEWCQDNAPFFAKKMIRYTNAALSSFGVTTADNIKKEAEDFEIILNSDFHHANPERKIEIAKTYFEYINASTESSTESSKNLVTRYNIDTLEIFLALDPEIQNWVLQACEGNEQTIFAKIDQFSSQYRSAFDAASIAYRRRQ